MKRTLLTLAALLTLMGARAAKAYELELLLSDSTKLSYPISEGEPNIYFTGGQVTIKGTSYAFSDVASFRVVPKESTGIEGTETAQGALTANKPVDVYTLGGQLVARGVKRVSLEALPAGTYIIRTAASSMKWIKR